MLSLPFVDRRADALCTDYSTTNYIPACDKSANLVHVVAEGHGYCSRNCLRHKVIPWLSLLSTPCPLLPCPLRMFNPPSRVRYSLHMLFAHWNKITSIKSSSMASPTPDNDTSTSPQDTSSTPDLSQRVNKIKEEAIARAIANQDGPRRREKILLSDLTGLGGRPGSGPIRILSNNGVLTELGKKVEQERLAKLAAATATTDDGEKEKPTAGSAEEST